MRVSLPMMAAGLAKVDSAILDLIFSRGNAGGIANILFLLEQLGDEAEREGKNPQTEINCPPPPADDQPPETTVTLLAIF